MTTYTLSAMAEKLEIPESTLRYYRTRHADFIPFVGEGRRRRYPDEALAVLLRTCELAKAGKAAVEIDEALSADYERVVELEQVEIETQDERKNAMSQGERNGNATGGDSFLPARQDAGDMVSYTMLGKSIMDFFAEQKAEHKRDIERLEKNVEKERRAARREHKALQEQVNELAAASFSSAGDKPKAKQEKWKQAAGIATAATAWGRDIKDMKRLTREAMKEIKKIGGNIDRMKG